jgi:hypothetical protein
MQFLNRVALYLGARCALLAEKNLAALVYMPLGARSGLETDARGADTHVGFEAVDGAGEVGALISGLLLLCREKQRSGQSQPEQRASHLRVSASRPKARSTLPGMPPRAG